MFQTMQQETEEEFQHMERMVQNQMDMLIQYEQYSSAESLISFFLSSLTTLSRISPIQKYSIQSQYLEKLGDVIYFQNNYRRALDYYRQVYTLLKQLSSMKTPNKTLKISSLALNPDESRVKFKESKCLCQLKDTSVALQELEQIPLKYRDIATHMLIGSLYKNANMRKQASSSYKEVLKLSPFSMEAIEALANLGESYQEITAIISEGARTLSLESLYDKSGWLFDYVHSLIYKRNGDYDKVNTILQPLFIQFPQNTQLLLQQGTCAVETEKNDQAYIIYKQIRKNDPYVVENMDRFGLMLHHLGDTAELNKLSQDVLSSSTNRPIGWLIVALYCDLKGQSEKAMMFVDKAISLDYKYSLSYVLKGNFLMSQSHPKQAAVAYFQANILQKDLMTLSGLIDANLSVGRYKEALESAKEALVLMPKSSTAYFIMGKVLAKSDKGQNESIRAFTKALKLNPHNHEAACKMADVLEKMNKSSTAIDCLKDIIGKGSTNCRLRIHLAKLLTSQGRYAEAITELHSVASIYPNEAEEATQELEKVESLLRGENTSMQVDDAMADDDDNDNNHNDSSNVHIHSTQSPITASSRRNIDLTRTISRNRDSSFVMSSIGASVGAIRGRVNDDMDESTYSDDDNNNDEDVGVDRELFAD